MLQNFTKVKMKVKVKFNSKKKIGVKNVKHYYIKKRKMKLERVQHKDESREHCWATIWIWFRLQSQHRARRSPMDDAKLSDEQAKFHFRFRIWMRNLIRVERFSQWKISGLTLGQSERDGSRINLAMSYANAKNVKREENGLGKVLSGGERGK